MSDDAGLANDLREHAAGLRQHATVAAFLSNAKMLAERRHGDLPIMWFESLYEGVADDLDKAAECLDESGLVEENRKLREAITMALQCTPSIGQKYVGLNGMTHRPVIQYDCGDPWEILRSALDE